MMLFHNRRPRGFHHYYIYVDERKELLKGIERRAKEGTGAEDTSLNAENYSARVKMRVPAGRERAKTAFGEFHFVILAIIILLLAITVYLFL